MTAEAYLYEVGASTPFGQITERYTADGRSGTIAVYVIEDEVEFTEPHLEACIACKACGKPYGGDGMGRCVDCIHAR